MVDNKPGEHSQNTGLQSNNPPLPPRRFSLPQHSISNNFPNEEVQYVDIKLPPFWNADPEAWFFSIEASFLMRRVSKKSKYLSLLASLPQEIVSRVRDVLPRVPTDQSYEDLKNAILGRLTPTNEERLEKLLFGCEMGDLKPSDYYRKLEQVASQCPDVNANLVYKLWERRIPPPLQQAVIPLDDREISERLRVADRVFQAGRGSSICPVDSQTCAVSASNSEVEALKKRIGELESLVSKLSFQGRGRSRSGGRNSGGRFPRNRSQTPGSSVCWYHRKFGVNATRCTQPCTFKPPPGPNNSGHSKN